jgi:phage I-like protein
MTAMKSIYIPKNVKTIAANEYDYNSPFFICDENLIIALEAEAITEFSYVEGDGGYLVPGTGFGEMWNVIEDEKKAEYMLGISYDEYIEILDHI